MHVSDLRVLHAEYERNVSEWRFLMASYEGAKELVRLGFLVRNERESLKNWRRRLQEAYGFSYSKSIVDLFNFYLFKKPVKRSLGILADDEAWQNFMRDCNLYGDHFDWFLHNQGRYASIQGHMGILIDKASVTFDTRAEELEAGIYPYVASYFPTAILDWSFARDDFNRPFLSYLKLLDDDGQYRLWWQDRWEVWREPILDDGTKAVGEIEAVPVAQGQNPLGEIPFVWLYNERSKTVPIGVSDIHDVARIDVSILRNLSQGEEVINYGAFPMMRKPLLEATTSQTVDETGVTAVLEFDPEHPESKPDWLDSQVKEPVDAILMWIARKVEEIYRSTNVGGMAATQVSTVAKSGVALRTEFQLLNSKLVSKATNLEKAERQIINFWLRWQEQEDLEKDTNIERPRTYEIDNLAADLENALTSSTIVKSKKFIQTLQKMVARLMLPGLEENQWAEIDEEIEASDTLSLIDPNSGLSEEELEAGGGPVTRRTLRRRVTEED
jgi:hypothetical protein